MVTTKDLFESIYMQKCNLALSKSFTFESALKNIVSSTLVVVVLILLNTSYIGVNLLDFSRESILALRLLSVTLIFLTFILNGIFYKYHPIIILLGIYAILGSVTSSISLSLVFIFLFAVATRSIPLNFIINYSIYTLALALIFSILLLYFGITENSEDITGVAIELGEGLRTRLTFGYKNVNAFASIISALCLLLMLANNKIWLRYLSAAAISIYFYNYTDSRTMLISVVMFAIFSMSSAILINLNYKRLIFVIAAGFVIFPPLISLTPQFFINQFPLLDFVLSGRLAYLVAFYNEMHPFRMIVGGAEPGPGVTVDNAFGLLIGAIGIPLFICLIARMLSKIREYIENSNVSMLAFLLSFWMYSFSESSMVRPESLIGLVFWIVLLQRRCDKSPVLSFYKLPTISHNENRTH